MTAMDDDEVGKNAIPVENGRMREREIEKRMRRRRMKEK